MLEGAAVCEGCHELIVIRDNVSYDVILNEIAYRAGSVHVCTPRAYGPADDCQSCGLPVSECGHVRPETPACCEQASDGCYCGCHYGLSPADAVPGVCSFTQDS